MWRLWLEGKIQMSEFKDITIDDVDAGCRALDVWIRMENARIVAAGGKNGNRS